MGNYFYIENRLSKIISLSRSIFQNEIFKNEFQETFNYDNDGTLLTTETIVSDGSIENVYFFYENEKLIILLIS